MKYISDCKEYIYFLEENEADWKLDLRFFAEYILTCLNWIGRKIFKKSAGHIAANLKVGKKGLDKLLAEPLKNSFFKYSKCVRITFTAVFSLKNYFDSSNQKKIGDTGLKKFLKYNLSGELLESI
ncbi:MAG: hypothetical protein ACQESS_08850 [Bacillota bacterium]